MPRRRSTFANGHTNGHGDDEADIDIRDGSARQRVVKVRDVEDDDEIPPKRKMYAMAVLLAGFGLAVGFVHIYGGQHRTGRVLLGCAVSGLLLGLTLHRHLLFSLVAVWLFDTVVGTIHLVRFNRKRSTSLARRASRNDTPSEPLLLN